jgi:type III secretion protein C
MTKITSFFSRVGLLAAPFALCLFSISLFLAPAPARAAAFAYTANNEALADFLCHYADSQDKACIVSPDISGAISGNLNFRTPEAFFAFLERSHNIITYAGNSGIYYYPRSAMQSLNLPLRRASAAALNSALREMLVYDARYPLRTIHNGKMLRLTAPPEYINLVSSLLADLEDSYVAAKGTRVFRLKHAWADDIEVTFLNKDVIIPGVATLLWNLTEGGNAPGLVNAGDSAAGAVERLKGSGLASRTGTQEGARSALEARQAARKNQRQGEEGKSGARILADRRLNAVIVWDDEELMPLYEALINEMDCPVDLVEIRTAIVDVSVDRLQELGISWTADTTGSGRNLGAVGGVNTPAGTDFYSTAGGGLNLSTIYNSGMDVFMARIHALEEDGDASVLSRPAVLTLDNTEASIEATNTYYIEVAGNEEVDLFDVTYGTILRVLPHVIPDEASGRATIKLAVHVEDGGSREAGAGSGVTYPIITKTMVSTQAVVGDNQALVVGGHYYEQLINGDSGVPVLRHIPMLGALFERKSDNYQKRERLFILSPRLVTLEDIQKTTQQYEELFNRSMSTPQPRVERASGGCWPRARESVVPMLLPASPAIVQNSSPAQGNQ